MPSFRFEWDESVSKFLSDLVEEAFAGEQLPDEIRYDLRQEPACDAILFEVSCHFQVPRGEASVSFTLNTGTGGLHCVGDPWPEPSVSGVSVTVNDGNMIHMWDEKSKTWHEIGMEE